MWRAGIYLIVGSVLGIVFATMVFVIVCEAITLFTYEETADRPIDELGIELVLGLVLYPLLMIYLLIRNIQCGGCFGFLGWLALLPVFGAVLGAVIGTRYHRKDMLKSR